MTTELERKFGSLIVHDPVVHPSLSEAPIYVRGKLLEPADLALMDQSGWRALSQTQGWTQPFMDRLTQLVNDWLSGSDRKELLSLARSPASDDEDLRPAELFRRWLDEKRLGRLNELTADFDETKPLAHYYALSHALRAVLSAVAYTEAVPSDYWETASRSLNVENVAQSPDTPPLDDDIASWLA